MEDIVKNNKLIAEFMGAKMIVENCYGISILEFPDKKTYTINVLKYHCSWDWLLPVWKKIFDTFNYKDRDTAKYKNYIAIPIFIKSVDISKTYEYIIEYVKLSTNKKQ